MGGGDVPHDRDEQCMLLERNEEKSHFARSNRDILE